MPVLLDEVLAAVPKGVKVLVDGTLGAGGHSFHIGCAHRDSLEAIVGFDRDQSALDIARQRLADLPCDLHLEHESFDALSLTLPRLNLAPDFLFFDLGVSSMQLDDRGARGFSFQSPQAPLDMRMDASRGVTAAQLIDSLSEEKLANLLFLYGEERASRQIASRIKHWRQEGNMETTADLVRACQAVYGRQRNARTHPATKTFQALRVGVNDELGQLERVLDQIEQTVLVQNTSNKTTRVAFISFHSLEDRIVKRAFRRWQKRGLVKLQPKRKATRSEIDANARSRSALLRVCEVLGAG